MRTIDKAVAFKYTHDLPAPFIVAKGKGDLAKKIVSVAKAHGISIAAEPELTDALYELEVQEFIPEEYFEIVAELLVFVERVRTNA